MSDQKKARNSIIVQGSVLVVTAFVTRIIGLLYRFPLTQIIGKTGNDYYSTAYSIYSILLIISSYSLPTAVSKMISEREAKGEYENARRIFKGSMIFAIIAGGLSSVILFFGADLFTRQVQTPLASIALRILSPVLLIVAVLGVLRGFFQGLRTTVPTAISQIIEQIFNAVVSVAAAYYLFSYGAKVGGVLGDEKNYSAAYGAAGGTLGTAIGALSALLFMGFLFMIYKSQNGKRHKRHRGEYVESYSTIFAVLITTIIPVIFATTVYNITSLAEMIVFKNLAVAQDYTAHQIHEWWGVYNGQYIVLQNVPISVASALVAPSVPALSASFAKRDHRGVQSKISQVTRFIMVIALPCTVGMFVLASPIMQLLFGDPDILSARILMIGSLSIPFFAVSTLSSGILQGINRIRIPVRTSLITLFAHMALLAVLMVGFHLNIYAVVLANCFDGFLMAVLNDYYVHKYSGTRYNWSKVFVLPALASLIMGAFVYVVYHVTYVIVSSNAISCVISVFVGMLVYFVVILKIGGLTEKELRRVPKGASLVRLAKKLHAL